ncbi:XF1762 family protein [Ectopseudomonas khazarica]|uniref:XF1762 family protein n=1 Tax=Ectopseudomonas khazarica TaxID=2502979 RepID=UPI003B96059C
MALEIVPISMTEANAFVEANHRHHGRVQGHKFSLGLADGDKIAGVVMVGRPVSRHLDDGVTLEVTRCCTDGTRNGCSKLYSAAWRAAKALGYRRLITYVLASESGSSLKGSGWRVVGVRGGGNWNTPSRPRFDSPNQGQKLLWEAQA